MIPACRPLGWIQNCLANDTHRGPSRAPNVVDEERRRGRFRSSQGIAIYMHLSPSALTEAIGLLERRGNAGQRGDIVETAHA
jgi:hypothetical protein